METRYGLSAAALKYLAALCMLVDHMGVVFPTMLSDLGLPAWADLLPRLIGAAGLPHLRLLRGGGVPADPVLLTAICSGWGCSPWYPRCPSPWPPARGAAT